MNNCSRLLATLCLTLSCIAILSGCGASESSVAGNYELDKEAVKAAAKAEMEKQSKSEDGDDMAAFGATMMLGMIETMEMNLNINADGTATMIMSGMGESETSTGKWMLDGKKITFNVNQEDGTIETISGTVSGDTITMDSKEEEDAPFDMVFKKKKS